MLSIGSNICEARVDGSITAFQRDMEAFSDVGLTAAELNIHGLDLVVNGCLNRRQANEIRQITADLPFRLSAHAPNPLNLMDRQNIQLHRDTLHASLEAAALLDAEVLVYHPGRFLVEESFPFTGPLDSDVVTENQLMMAEAILLQEAADTFPEVVIALENARPYLHHSPYCYAEFPDRLVEQVKRIGRPNIGITLDFGHLHLSCQHYGLDRLLEVQRMAHYIVHCHVHDNFGNPVSYAEKNQCHLLPLGKGDLHLPVGWGTIPFAELFREFIADYDGLLICELRGRYFAHTGEAAQNLAAILHDIGAGARIAEQTVTARLE